MAATDRRPDAGSRVSVATGLLAALLRRLPRAGRQRSAALAALMGAATALPGLAADGPAMQDAYVDYGRYGEGGRETWTGNALGTVRNLEPIRIDSLHQGAGLSLSSRTRLSVDYLQDTWSGATPILAAPEAYMTVSSASALTRDDARTSRALVPVVQESGVYVPRPELVHMLTSASPETRRQATLTLSHEWDESALSGGGGVSREPDFDSAFLNLGGRLDFDRKLTTLSGGLSLTRSKVDAILGAPATYIDYGLYRNPAYAALTSGATITDVATNGSTTQHFTGERNAWTANLGVKRVLDRDSTFSFGMAYAHESGMLENPYKLVLLAFADPTTPLPLFGGNLNTRIVSVAENRPDTRGQWTLSTGYKHFFAGADAALHLDYRYSRDDWGVAAHALEARWAQAFRGWLVTPGIRYTSQSAADFYLPYLLTAQRRADFENASGKIDFTKLPIRHYSSDDRLAAYGALGFGLTLERDLARGVRLAAGYQAYQRRAGLKLGGDGGDNFIDLKSWSLNAGLRIDFDALRLGEATASADEHAHHHHGQDHAGHAGMITPAGVMGAHMMPAGGFMLGYRYQWSRTDGAMLTGTRPASDADILANGCPSAVSGCSYTVRNMTMQMHMLDLMWAPTDWLNVMLMPQLMDMGMEMRAVAGGINPDPGGAHDHGAHPFNHSGGVGDTLGALMFKLAGGVHLGLGVSVPTGSIDQRIANGDLQHYHMQIGSGTWDFLPSLTWNGAAGDWFWGAQWSGVKRMQERNAAGYRLGAVNQLSGWFGYQFTPWFAASLRGQIQRIGAIQGAYTTPPLTVAPLDEPSNYGARYRDLGVGVSLAVPGRPTDRVQIEWMEPLRDEVNGYQLERDGTLHFNWNLMF